MSTSNAPKKRTTNGKTGEEVKPAFPLARIQKIMKADKDVGTISKEAVFMMSFACEHFVSKLTDEACTVAQLDGKRRKLVQYIDLAQAVQNNPDLHFLKVMLPIPMPASVVKEQRRKKKETQIEEDQGTVDEVVRQPAENEEKEDLQDTNMEL
ncbi:histone-fold-containing protein [Atractiella rhizophila]|nr:histone-fold-containing protein [Atractiella rhizophila]